MQLGGKVRAGAADPAADAALRLLLGAVGRAVADNLRQSLEVSAQQRDGTADAVCARSASLLSALAEASGGSHRCTSSALDPDYNLLVGRPPQNGCLRPVNAASALA